MYQVKYSATIVSDGYDRTRINYRKCLVVGVHYHCNSCDEYFAKGSTSVNKPFGKK